MPVDRVYRLAQRIAALEKEIRALGVRPQLASSSVDDGALAVTVHDSTTMQVGLQHDGTSAPAVLTSPTPPTPSVPLVTASPGILTVYWDGTFADGSVVPMDFSRVTVHAVPNDIYVLGEPAATDQRYIIGSIDHATGGQISAALEQTEYVVFLHAWTLAGVFSATSDVAVGTPEDAAAGASLFTWVRYADTPTTGISDDPTGKAYIGLAFNKASDVESDNYADYAWSKIQGDQGVPGEPGSDGQPTFIWIKYATDATGTGLSDDPTGKAYIGIAYNKSTATESNVATDYTWSLIKGPQGDPGANGTSATTVHVGNDAVAIPVTAAGAALAAGTITIPFSGWIGATRTAATAAVGALPAGVTLASNTAATGSADGSIVLSYAAGAVIGAADSGTITITVTCNSIAFPRYFSWARAYTGAAGAPGGAGTSATSLDLSPDSILIPTSSAGAALAAGSVVVAVKGLVGTTASATTVGTITGLPTNVTATIGSNGGTATTVTLAWASGATIGASASGTITVPVTVNGITFNPVVSWARAISGAAGAAGKGVSSSAVSYQVGTSATVAPTGTWTSTPGATTTGQYLWTRTIITWTDATTTTFYTVAAHGATGATGKSVASVTPYYLRQATGTAAPGAPSTNPPPAPWTATEPAWQAGTDLYVAQVAVFSDATFGWSAVSKSATYTAISTKPTILYAPADSTTDANGNTTYYPDPDTVGSGPFPVATEWVDTSIITETDANGNPVLDDNGAPITYQPFDQYVWDGTIWQHSQFSFDVNLALGAVSSTVDTHEVTLFGDPNDPSDTGLVGSLGLTQNQINAFIALIQGVLMYDATNDVWPSPQLQDDTLTGLAGTNPGSSGQAQLLLATDTNTFTPQDIVAWAIDFISLHDTTAAQDFLNVYDATDDIGDYVSANFVNDFNTSLTT